MCLKPKRAKVQLSTKGKIFKFGVEWKGEGRKPDCISEMVRYRA